MQRREADKLLIHRCVQEEQINTEAYLAEENKESAVLGISIAINELDSDESLCKVKKTSTLKVHLNSVAGYEQYAEFDMVVNAEDAKKTLGADWEAFLKRNRLDAGVETIYLEKIKNEADKQRVTPIGKKLYNGWIPLTGLPDDVLQSLRAMADMNNRLTEWDMLSFDDLNETCARCPLSWDNKRGCIGTFGPESSLLPSIAEKYGCKIIASVPKYAREGTKLTPEDAKQLLEEVKVLREKLPLEGKTMVRRYGGVLDRLDAVANTSMKYGARFYFV
ncbi:MAG: hypothetical protein LUQ14_04005 [Methanomassiliicoccales archaeon]|nr:hypothetical protein [Methanomassiliicoccales archaeon]